VRNSGASAQRIDFIEENGKIGRRWRCCLGYFCRAQKNGLQALLDAGLRGDRSDAMGLTPCLKLDVDGAAGEQHGGPTRWGSRPV
jgi:hypothetical protein